LDDKIAVIIVDDFELSRVGMRYMLRNIPFVGSVKETTDSKGLFELIKKEEPDVIFMDVNLEHENGIELTKKVLTNYPHTYVIAITSSNDIQHFIGMVDAGAVGFLLKNMTNTELEKALQEILQGNTYYSKEFLTVANQLLPRQGKKSKIKLSEREMEVLRLICRGYSNQEIADELNLSPHTIDAHRKKLLNKIGAKNTASMITISIRDGIIQLS
jgi:DNA-binding NarL/FixJ family response regulator